MRKIYLFLLWLVCFADCKDPEEADLSGSEKISEEDFLKAFPAIDLPVIIYDTALKHFGDSIIMSKAVLTQFVNDSALQQFTGNSNNYNIHPGAIIHKKERDFLLTIFSSPLQTKLGVFVFDDKHKFLVSFPVLDNGKKDSYQHSVTITEEPTFIIKKEKTTPNNITLYSRTGFAYSPSANAFTEVLHDSNEDTAKNDEIINPIDTFPSTNKFSGDYIADKRNFISVRDGKNALTYTFFIHFEKNDGKCIGELKGMMSLTDEKNALFTESGDPCIINFKFTSNSINIKEQDNCGNHRGITCPFNFTFKKKKPEKRK